MQRCPSPQSLAGFSSSLSIHLLIWRAELLY
nr:MAG TPA: hypothetical protein [Caudoviricetes sp.]